MIVDARIQNTPANVHEHGFIVARVAEDTTLWWYGIYNTMEKARSAAMEIKNGIVLERTTYCPKCGAKMEGKEEQ